MKPEGYDSSKMLAKIPEDISRSNKPHGGSNESIPLTQSILVLRDVKQHHELQKLLHYQHHLQSFHGSDQS